MLVCEVQRDDRNDENDDNDDQNYDDNVEKARNDNANNDRTVSDTESEAFELLWCQRTAQN